MKRVLIPFLFVIAAIFICAIAPNYYEGDTYSDNEIRVVLNSKEIPHNKSLLPDEVVIVDGKVMFSQNTVDILFDKWLYYDEKYDTIISTTDTGVAKLKIDSNKININNEEITISVPTQRINEKIYIPVEELQDFYNVDISYNEKVIITTEKANYIKAKLNNKLKIKAYQKLFSKVIATCLAEEVIDIFEYKDNPEWVVIRRENGDLGYAKYNKIDFQKIDEITPNIAVQPVEPVNIIWEYAENSTANRDSESKIESIDVVSPTWIYFANNDGKLRNTIDRAYISWAHRNNYEVWAVFKNDGMGIENTSKIVTDMKIRENVINDLIKICKDYNIDGINLDFENMKKGDAEDFSQFVRELSATARRNNLIISVDVTVPDGSDTWSLCYNRYEIADVVDYLVVMTYDQYSANSKVPGSTAELSWVEHNIKKLVERDGIKSNKIIMGIPLYSRLWWSKNEAVSSSAIDMNRAVTYLNKGAKWDDEAGQYYAEYTDGNTTYYIWIEDDSAVKEKLSLIDKYNLSGAAYWRMGFEMDGFWNKIK